MSPASPSRRNLYRVRRPAVVSFSGGRTSAYMLKHIVDAYGGELPGDVAVVYANTGLERAETLDFIYTCATALGVPIVWVEYDRDAPHRTRLVDYRTASRDGAWGHSREDRNYRYFSFDDPVTRDGARANPGASRHSWRRAAA